MKGTRYTEPQILEILGQVDAGQPLAELTRLHGVAVSTIHRWKAKYGGMTKDETKRFRLLEEENRRLKKLATTTSPSTTRYSRRLSQKNGEPRCNAAVPDSVETAGGGFCAAALWGDGTTRVSSAGLLAFHPKAQKPWRRKG